MLPCSILVSKVRSLRGYQGGSVADIGERFDLLIEAAHPHDANRKLIKHLRHERGAPFSFLTIGRR